ncbi:putative membrane protein [Knoellia remsis]|uniref:Putative membrane protein n=1 Tax=Knoellia remsis TaxID=407159 RepID=A0A2T0UN16_9MICO|nr:vitamin K epoxide reductase family protein [Knoellia remsis]PRY59294.1 putative membrane protein [Knoellia remsis]
MTTVSPKAAGDAGSVPDTVPEPASSGTAAGTVPGQRLLGWVLTVCGSVGLVAAFVLMVEKLRLLTNPFYVPSCSLSEAVNCTAVMQSDQATVFGFPNPLLGLAGFAVVVTVGVVLLTGAGRELPGWFWLGLQAGVTFGVVFVTWLMTQTLFSIRAICPYCVVVWVVTIIAFCFVTAANAVAGRFGAGLARAVPAGVVVPAGVAAIWLVTIGVLSVAVASGW